MEPKLTHKGWWMFCPVKLGALDTDAPLVVPRWFWCAPLYLAAGAIQTTVIQLCSLLIEGYEPQWYFAVTGELPDSASPNEGKT